MAIIARRKENTWYIAGISTSERNNYELDLKSMPFIKSPSKLILYTDGIEQQEWKKELINTMENIEIKINRGGGFIIICK